MKHTSFSAFVLLLTAARALAIETFLPEYPRNDREAARQWFNAAWNASIPSTPSKQAIPSDLGFVGNMTISLESSTSLEWKQKAVLRYNLYRRMVGVSAVGLSDSATAKAQLAAALHAANPTQYLNHKPPTSWLFWSQAAYDACTGSELAGDLGATAISGYFADDGDNNVKTGHRNQLMGTAVTGIGIGDAIGAGNTRRNATYRDFDGTPTDVSFLQRWPSPGYIPHQLIPGRWNISEDDLLDSSLATVAVTRSDGAPVTVTVINRTTDNLVWTIDGTPEGYAAWTYWRGYEYLHLNKETPLNDITYHVKITGLKYTYPPFHNGQTYVNGTGVVEYDVTGFNPDVPTIGTDTTSARMANISSRGVIGTGENVMIAGFVVNGSGPKTLLVRAAGPALNGLVNGNCADPLLELHNTTTTLLTNDNWGDTQGADIAKAALRVGAFTWAPGSKDAAMLVTLNPGIYSAVVHGVNDATGIGLVEVYDVSDVTGLSTTVDYTSTAGARVVNISTRGTFGSGDDVMIAGFVIDGSKPKTVLVRAAGPALKGLVNGYALDPSLEIHDTTSIIATNDNWGDKVNTIDQTPYIKDAAAKVGAYAWPDGSNDSAIILTLKPGIYSAVVHGTNAGLGLVEVYEIN